MVGVATEAGAEYAFGDHTGLRGRAIVEPRHADASLLRGGAIPLGEFRRTPFLALS